VLATQRFTETLYYTLLELLIKLFTEAPSPLIELLIKLFAENPYYTLLELLIKHFTEAPSLLELLVKCFTETSYPLLELLIEDVLPEPGGTGALEARDHVGDLLDRLDLLAEVLGLQEVGEVGVGVGVGQLVQRQQRLVDFLLEVQRRLQAGERPVPLLARGRVDLGEEHSAAALVLVLHQLHGVLPLFVTLVLHELGHSIEGNVIPLVVEAHSQVNIACIQFHVYLLVDGSFTGRVEILTDCRHLDI